MDCMCTIVLSRHIFDKISTLVISIALYSTSQLLLLLGGTISNIRMVVYIQKSEHRLGRRKSTKLVSLKKRVVLANGLNILLYFFEASAIACHLSLGNDHHHIFTTLLFCVLFLRMLINFFLYTWKFINVAQARKRALKRHLH